MFNINININNYNITYIITLLTLLNNVFTTNIFQIPNSKDPLK